MSAATTPAPLVDSRARKPGRDVSIDLTATQIRWLGVLLVAAQVPHLAFVPRWVAFLQQLP